MNQSGQDFASLYRRFEDRFRGTQESITRRLEAYIPVLEEIEKQLQLPRALDLGMGRGEWLRLLKARGWSVAGVDHIREMINIVDLEGAHIVEGDILEFLRSCPADSYELVSAFHVAEHLSQPDLRELVAEMHRVLIPGGVVILETPNPENLTVSSWSFWMDPTHLQPIPPFLLSFLVEDRGFHQPFIFRLNGALPTTPMGCVEELIVNLFLSAPDYAVISEKRTTNSTSSTWRTKLSAITQPCPTDIHRLLTLARGIDQVQQNPNMNLDDHTAAWTGQLSQHWEKIFDLSAQQIEALKVELRKDREITDLKIREFALTLSQKFRELEVEVEKLKSEKKITGKFAFIRHPYTERKLPVLIDRRLRRFKNSIKKRLPDSVQEKAVRRWKKLQRSIAKRLPGRPASTRVPIIKDHRAPHSSESLDAQLQSRPSTMIKMLDSLIAKHSARSRNS